MTYTWLSLAFLGAAALVAVLAVLRGGPRDRLRGAGLRPGSLRDRLGAVVVPLATSAVVLGVLTAVFDNVMIAAGLMEYSDRHVSGIRVGAAPLEDFAYPLAAVILLPSLWALFTTPDRPPRPSRSTLPSRAHVSGRALAARLLLASRPVSWINTAFPFAAAYLVSTRHIDAALIVGTIFFLVPYNLAMYGINDVFDYESDLANPRKGGLEGATLDPGAHRATLVAAALTCAPFLVVLVLLGSPLSWLVLAISMAAVLAYSVPLLRFKERPFLDSVTSSVHFVSPAVYGLALAGASLTPALAALLTAFLLWGVASHAFGAVQDVVPDRQGRIRSIATVMGAAWTTRFAIAAWLLAGLLMLATPWPAALAGLLVLPYIAVALPFVSVPDAESARANVGWRRFIWLNYLCGFLVTVLLIAFTLERPLP